VRQIGGGSLHIAHVSKAEGADKKPFGSTFWHNGARGTWYVQLETNSEGDGVRRIGLFHRKANLGRLRQPLGFAIEFGDERTTFRRVNVADSPELSGGLSVRQRMAHLLRRGAMDADVIAEEIEAELETVKRTARRYRKQFIVIDGGRVGLLERSEP
jgi:hypothetical protein